MVERSDLVSYASSFVAFLVRDPAVLKEVRRVLVFGSAVSGGFDEESDIDLFVDVADEGAEGAVRARLELFEASEEARRFALEGLRNRISLRVGRLEEWESLRSAIASSSLALFGPADLSPASLRTSALFVIELAGCDRALKARLWRALYGHTQRVGGRTYSSKGLVARAGGARLGRGAFLVPAAHAHEVTGLLNRERVRYTVREVWLA
jgi:predicted nucleotidyltransferase